MSSSLLTEFGDSRRGGDIYYSYNDVKQDTTGMNTGDCRHSRTATIRQKRQTVNVLSLDNDGLFVGPRVDMNPDT